MLIYSALFYIYDLPYPLVYYSLNFYIYFYSGFFKAGFFKFDGFIASHFYLFIMHYVLLFVVVFLRILYLVNTNFLTSACFYFPLTFYYLSFFISFLLHSLC